MVQFSGAYGSYQETVVGKLSHDTLGAVFWRDLGGQAG